MKPFRTILRGITVLVKEVDWVGLWVPAGTYAQSEILIQPKQRKWQLADTLLHEGLHAEFPDLTEEQVRQVAGELVGLLRKSGVFDARKNGKKQTK
jgi:hypothetical protein